MITRKRRNIWHRFYGFLSKWAGVDETIFSHLRHVPSEAPREGERNDRVTGGSRKVKGLGRKSTWHSLALMIRVPG